MDVGEMIASALVLLIGAYILFEVAAALIKATPAFGQIGLAIVGAFVVGAIAYLKKR